MREEKACEYCGAVFTRQPGTRQWKWGKRKYCGRACAQQPKPLERRFWRKVLRGDSGSCWLWLGANNGEKGYGRFNIGGRQVYPHRVSWEFANGPIPDGLCVLHRCDNPACVNPTHLFLGTIADNNRDMYAKGRQGNRTFNPPRGSESHLAKLTENQVLEIRAANPLITQAELAKKYGVGRQAISKIRRGERWQHLIPPTTGDFSDGMTYLEEGM